MLNDLLKGHEKSRLILISDSIDAPGKTLLMNWIVELYERVDSIVLLCTECQCEYYKSWLPEDILKRVTFIDGRDIITKEEDLLSVVSCALTVVRGQAAVLFDSLSLHIIMQQPPSVCTTLHKIASEKQVCQVVCVLHHDVHDQQSCQLLHHMASTVLSLSSEEQGVQVCCVRHLRPTGKVFKTEECFSADENFHIQNIKPFCQRAKGKSQYFQDSSKDDPIKNLPFNLSLTETEKVARSQVVLPYESTGSGDKTSSSGRIHYEPDDADDLDEEDPDDDLNI